ncbi:MAG TPA: hypothetical protein VJL27_02920 [Patescibacteria group bacterium]|nr:hypothetical protein [Patescibacteria group bacterium]
MRDTSSYEHLANIIFLEGYDVSWNGTANVLIDKCLATSSN